jgi:hypothetical protein
MTKEQLGNRLDNLEVYGVFEVSERVLASIFGNGTLDDQVVNTIRTFANAHQCIFMYVPYTREEPRFEKVDEDGCL